MDNFTQIPFTAENLDIYYIRTSIFNALNESLPHLTGNLLDIGCGKMPYKKHILENSEVQKYIGLDIENALSYDANVQPDFTWNGNKMPFEANQYDSALATEVFEHCPDPELVMKETCRVLKPNGTLFFTVPFLWPLHEVPHDAYRYTPWSLERHLRNSGFRKVEIQALGGWHASMAQMLGLWVRRCGMTPRKKKTLSIILKPIIRFLTSKDIRPVDFKESSMVTGFYGIATK